MKKFISLLLIFAMLFVEAVSFADSDVSAQMEKALIAVKSKIDVDASLSVFESEVTKYSGKTNYNFMWNDENYEKSVSVSCDSMGRIINYYNHSLDVSEKRLSSVSKEEIISFAEEFLKKAIPEMYGDFSDVLIFDEASYNVGTRQRYTLSFKREKNGISVKDNFVNVTVCISKEEKPFIRSLSSNIDYDAEFAAKSGEAENLTQKYTEAFPVELVYQNEYNNNWKELNLPRTYPVLIYRIKDNNTGYILVESGETAEEDATDDLFFKQESSMDSAVGESNRNEMLTEQELAHLAEVEGLLSSDEIIKRVKKLPYITFPQGVTLENSSLIKNADGDYIYSLHYSSNDKEKYLYVSLSANAKDGKLLSFYMNDGNEEGQLSQNSQKAAQNKIEEFLLAAAAEEFKVAVLDNTSYRNTDVTSYYYRTVNGIKHVNNGMSVVFDGKNSHIKSYSLNYTDGDFSDPNKAIDGGTAYEKLLSYSPIIRMHVKIDGKYRECITLEKHGVEMDALTGEIKNKYEETASFNYDDVKGHWAEDAALKLAGIQVGFNGTSLKPQEYVTQSEFLRLASSGVYGYYYNNYSDEELYKDLISLKIISEEEKNPFLKISREDAFIYIIRFAGLEKVAKLENIYKIDYADSALLSKGKIGYCAILSGLGVICGDGGKLRPKDNLTRAEALTMLYRYLLTV